jgi:hypothetical protein
MLEGFSMEVKNREHRDFLSKMASKLYRGSILFFIYMLLSIILLSFTIYGENHINQITYIIVAIGCIVTYVFILSVRELLAFKKANRINFVLRILGFFSIFGVIFLIYSIIFTLLPLNVVTNVISITPLEGHVTIEMQSVYHKSNLEIPVLIWITGPDTGLNISLFKGVEGNLSEVANISFGPSSIDKNIKFNKYVIADGLGNGKYNIFINTTNIDSGYYELRAKREYHISEASDTKGFFLLN